MRHIYSCSTMPLCRVMSAFDALKTIRQAGFDGADFSLNVFSDGENAPLRQNNWRQWAQSVADCAAGLELPIVQAHASWQQSIAPDFTYAPPDEIYARTLEACHILGCRKLVFHPLLLSRRIESASELDSIHAYNVRWFGQLLPLAQRLGVTVELENMFDFPHLQKPGDPPFPYSDAEMLLALADALESPQVGICLDTGHASISGADAAQMIGRFGQRLDCLHLNDNFGRISGVYEDLHLFPASGRLPWQEIFTALKQTGYHGTLNLEVRAQLPFQSQQVRLCQLRAGREVTELLAQQAGF